LGRGRGYSGKGPQSKVRFNFNFSKMLSAAELRDCALMQCEKKHEMVTVVTRPRASRFCRAGHTCNAVDKDMLVVMGGRDITGLLSDIHVLHLGDLRWSELRVGIPNPTTLDPLCNHLAAALDSVPSYKIFVYGGQVCNTSTHVSCLTADFGLQNFDANPLCGGKCGSDTNVLTADC